MTTNSSLPQTPVFPINPVAEIPIRYASWTVPDISRSLTRPPNTDLYAVAANCWTRLLSSAKIYGSHDAVLDDPDGNAFHVRWVVLTVEKQHIVLKKPVALNVTKFDRKV